jgi:hypothetical protein
MTKVLVLGGRVGEISPGERNYVTLLEIKLNGIDPVHVKENQQIVCYFLPRQIICGRQLRLLQC